jgi:hypothetical protein
MTVLSNGQPAGIGHNNPPPSLQTTLQDTYGLEIGKVEVIAKRANELPAKLDTAEDREKAGAVANDADLLAKALTKLHRVEKEPYLTGGRIVDGYFNPNILRLDRIASGMLGRISAANAEIRRKADEERRRQEKEQRRIAAEARAAADAAAAAGRTEDAVEDLKDAAAAEVTADEIALAPRANVDDQIKTSIGNTGAALGTRKDWTFEITDFDAIDLNKLKLFIKREDIEKALRAYVKQQKDNAPLAGVRIYQDEKATIRR